MVRTLFTPFRLKSLTLENRIVMAPMTRIMSPGGIPGEDVADYYARRAENAVGLIVTEATTIRRGGAANDPSIPNFHKPEALSGWKNVVEKVHAKGGRIAPQIWHMGMVRKVGSGPEPDAPTDSPSGLTHKGRQVTDAPTSAEVDDMVLAYADAVADAEKLGFDCVEIHGAHGYLIDQFFWDAMNKRDDRYGGTSLIERATFASDILKEVRRRVSPDFPVIFRYSQWKQQDYKARLAETPAELEAILGPMADAGVDVFDASVRYFDTPAFRDISDMTLAGWAKKVTGKLTSAVGGIGLNKGRYDSVGDQKAPSFSAHSGTNAK